MINIVTPTGEGPPTVNASIEGGSFATSSQYAGLTGAQGPLHYAVSLSHFQAGDTPVTPPGLLAPGEAAIGDAYDNLTASAKLGLDLSRALSLGLVLRYVDTDYRSTGENFDVFPAVPDAIQTLQKERQFFTRGEASLDLFGGRVKTTAGVAYANFRTTIQSPDDESFGLPPPVIDDGDRLKFDVADRPSRSIARDTLLLGADETVDRLIDNPVSAIQSQAGGFVELQSRPPGRPELRRQRPLRRRRPLRRQGHLAIGSGLCRGRHRNGAAGQCRDRLQGPDPERAVRQLSGLRLLRQPGPGSRRSSFGYDAGFEQMDRLGSVRASAQPLGSTTTSATSSRPTPPEIPTTPASAEPRPMGWRAFASWELSDRLGLRADYTWTIARDDVARQELLRRPKTKASLATTWQASRRLRLAATLVYVGAWVDGNRDFSIPRLTASPYATVGVSGDYDLGHGLTVFARIDNLLDRRYQDPVGFDKPGIGAYGGVRLALKP